MAVVFLLAHFDDEYCALPLILQARAAGEDCRFLHVADYRSPRLAARRRAETRAFLASLGLDPGCAVHVGGGTGILDGSLIEALPQALPAIRRALDGLAVERLVTPAWEGGHPDHDACAVMAAVLAGELGVPVRQFGLYHGHRTPRPFHRACSPLAVNGPQTRIRLTAGQWLAWLAAVRFFPSQAWNWLGLWPAMFMTFAARGGFAWQALAPERVRERPHAGRLHYEWMFRTPYGRVRALADAALGQAAGRPTIRNRPANISR